MELSKSTLLPIMGMVVLALFIAISYIQESVFLNQILICSFILSIVFIGKIREDLSNTSNRIDRNLSK
jgi:hypothetical protein